jgi:hypothetical protein
MPTKARAGDEAHEAGWAVHAQGQTRQAWTAHSASALTFILVDVPSMQL